MILEVADKALAFAGECASIVQFLRSDTKRGYACLVVALLVGGATYMVTSVPRADSKEPGKVTGNAVPQNEPLMPAPEYISESAASLKELNRSLSILNVLGLGISGGASITPDSLLEALKSEAATDLQKAQMIRRITGERVAWHVAIRAVNPGLERNGNLVVLFEPDSSIDDQPQMLMTATFPLTEENALADVGSGESALIEGELAFDQSETGWSVRLVKCRLLAHPAPTRSGGRLK